MASVATAVDAAMEATILPSFSRIGPLVRSRLFDWTPTAALPRLDGKTVLVTGATSGLGGEAATELAGLGASVRLLARDGDKLASTISRIRSVTGNEDVSGGLADLADLGQVRSFAHELSTSVERLDAVVHNAGAMMSERQVTVDGIEKTVQLHLVAPFLLTTLLLPQLEATPTARVVWVTSGGMYSQRLSVDDLEMPAAGYAGATAYARAKRAQVALVRHWAPMLTSGGTVMHAMHPGWSDTPGVRESLPRFGRVMGPLLRTPQEGADTMVWLAAAAEPARSTGQLWLDRRVRAIHKLPRTRRPDEAIEAARLFAWCQAKAGS